MGRLLQRWSGKFVPYSPARAAGATNAVCLPNRANQQAELKVLPKKARREAGLYLCHTNRSVAGEHRHTGPAKSVVQAGSHNAILLAIVEGEAGETARSDEG